MKIYIPSPCCQGAFIGEDGRGAYGCLMCGAVVSRGEMAQQLRLARNLVRDLDMRLVRSAQGP